MYAVIKMAGFQYRVEKGQVVRVPRLSAEEGATLTVEETICAGLILPHRGTPWNLYSRAHPDAKKALYGILNDNAMPRHHAGVVRTLGYIGNDEFIYQVCDNGGLCDTAIVSISIIETPNPEENRPPVAVNDNTRGNVNTPVVGLSIAENLQGLHYPHPAR